MSRVLFTTNGYRLVMLFMAILLWPNFEGVAQVKIGENPQNIDSGSLLELESDELVLVITRVTTQQMNNLTPMAGALVYNTDVGCVHSFNGSTWVNLCTQGGTGGVSIAPGNSITDNGGAFYNDQGLQDQVFENTIFLEDHITNDEDLDGTNELSNLLLNGNVITLSNPLTPTNEIDLTPILGGGGNPNDELISSGAVVGNDLIINEGTSNQVTIDVTSLAGGGSGSNNSAFEVASGNLSITDGGGTLSVPLTDLNTGGGANLGNSNLTQIGGNRTYDLNNQNLVFSGNGNIGIGATTPQEKLHIDGNLRLEDQFLDTTGDAGNAGEVLSSTGGGTNWVPASVASSPYHAAGKMNQNSPVNSFNILSVNRMGPGDYRVFFAANASTADYVVQVSLLNTGAASLEVTGQTTDGFTVQIYDNSGTPIDGSWFFTVIDF